MITNLRRNRDRALALLGSSPEYRIILIIVAIGLVMSVVSPYFFKLDNLMDLLESVAVLSILGFGMTFVLLIGELDMSVGSVMAIAAITTNVLLRTANLPSYAAILCGLLSGLVIGAANGAMAVFFEFPSLITTLAVMSALRGIVYLLTGNAPLAPYDNKAYFYIGNGMIANAVPVPVAITAAILVFLSFVLSKTRQGRVMIMTGANRSAATVSGINTKMVGFSMFLFCGLLAAVAGILLGSKLESVFPEFGMDYELKTITAAVIGGVSLFGGRGSFFGTFLGAVLIGLIFNIINLTGLNPYWQSIVIGLIIFVAVLSDKIIYEAITTKRTVNQSR